MSHELTEQDSMLSASGRKHWHFDLGTPVNLVDGDVTVADAPKLAGLDWLVEHRPLFVPHTVGITDEGDDVVEYVEVDDRRAVMRVDNDEYLGNVGSIHTAVQNETLFDLAAAIQAESDGDVLIETAGSLKGNRLVWVLAKLQRDVVVEGDKQVPYLLLANAHDASMQLQALTTLIRVVCWNTLSWALDSAAMSWTARHTTGVDIKVGEIRQKLGMTWAYVDAWEAEVQRMTEVAVARPQFDKFVERMVPIVDENPTDRMVTIATEKREQIRALYEGETVAPFTGTAWGAFNAGTEWQQWRRPVKGATRSERLGERVVKGRVADDNGKVRRLLEASVPALSAPA